MHHEQIKDLLSDRVKDAIDDFPDDLIGALKTLPDCVQDVFGSRQPSSPTILMAVDALHRSAKGEVIMGKLGVSPLVETGQDVRAVSTPVLHGAILHAAHEIIHQHNPIVGDVLIAFAAAVANALDEVASEPF